MALIQLYNHKPIVLNLIYYDFQEIQLKLLYIFTFLILIKNFFGI